MKLSRNLIAIFCVFCFIAALPVCARTGKPKIARTSLLIFPFDQLEVASLPDGFGMDIALGMRDMLVGNGKYAVIIYRERLSPIVRSKGDLTIKPTEAQAPFFEDRTKAEKLAKLISTDYFLIGNVDQVETTGNVGKVSLTAEIYDTKTGKLIMSLQENGVTPEYSKTEDIEEIRALATGDAVNKIVKRLIADPEKAAPVVKTEPAKPAAK